MFNKSFPLTQLNSSSKNNWFDKDLLQLLSVKEKIFKKFCVKKTLISKVNHNKARTIYVRTLKEKEAFYASVFKNYKNDLK